MAKTILNFKPLSWNMDFCIKVWYNKITAEGCASEDRK